MMRDDRRTAIGMSLSLTHESRLLIEVPLPGWPSATKRSAFGFGYAPQDRDLITRTSCGARRSVSNWIDALFVMTMGSWNFAVGPDGVPRSISFRQRENKSMFKKMSKAT